MFPRIALMVAGEGGKFAHDLQQMMVWVFLEKYVQDLNHARGAACAQPYTNTS